MTPEFNAGFRYGLRFAVLSIRRLRKTVHVSSAVAKELAEVEDDLTDTHDENALACDELVLAKVPGMRRAAR